MDHRDECVIFSSHAQWLGIGAGWGIPGGVSRALYNRGEALKLLFLHETQL